MQQSKLTQHFLFHIGSVYQIIWKLGVLIDQENAVGVDIVSRWFEELGEGEDGWFGFGGGVEVEEVEVEVGVVGGGLGLEVGLAPHVQLG